jgi:pyrroline-5-carboxylate reductase
LQKSNRHAVPLQPLRGEGASPTNEFALSLLKQICNLQSDMRIGFIGAGKMAAALARGAVNAGLCAAEEIRASARSAPSREAFARKAGIALHQVSADNCEITAGSDAVFLCVKPAAAKTVLGEIAPHLRGQPVISIVAGVRLAELEAAAGSGVPIIRTMPNTPVLVGRGATAFACGAAATDAHVALVEKLFGALGDVYRVDEKLIDAVNGLSGSGPAYVYLVIEALADGGVLMGLPRPLAAALAAQTVLGAAEMVRQTGEPPADLREAVTSPGGTTIAALAVLEQAGVRAAMIGAVRAATERAREMGGR